MKRFYALLLAAVIAMHAVGCGKSETPVDPEKAKTSHKYRGGGEAPEGAAESAASDPA